MKRAVRPTLIRVIVSMLIVTFLMSGATALADYCRVVNAKMPVYSDSKLKTKAGTVKKWTIVVVKSTSSGVAKLSVNGKKRYAKTSYLSTAHDISPFELYGTYRTAKKCKIYSYPSTSSKSITVKKGLLIETVKQVGNWILCQSTDGKKMGYIQRKNVVYSD